MNSKILFSVPSQSHVEIALDEVYGMQQLGYECETFHYAGKDGYESKLGRLYIIFFNAFKLIKLAVRFNPDIIYFNSRLEVLAGIRDAITILLCRFFYSKHVIFVIKSHGSDIEVVNDQSFLMKRLVMPFLKKHINAWLFLSEEEKMELDKLSFFEPEKMWVTKNIIRVNQFHIDPDFKQKLNIPSDHKILLYSGRIIAEKGILEVVKAFAKISSNHKVTLIIVGSGNAMVQVKELCYSYSLEDSVRFVGFIPEQEVIPFYSNCDILVFPTYFPEGFPMALFNSVSAGMAIVTTKTRAAADYLIDPKNCLWVEPKNVSSLTIAVERLITDLPLIDTMREENKKLAPRFSMARVCFELSNILQKVQSVQRGK